MKIKFWKRRALAWTPIWIPVLLVHLWALWIVVTVEPTTPGKLSSGDDPILFLACLVLAPIALVAILVTCGIGIYIGRRLWAWSLRMDSRAKADAVLDDYK